MRRHHSHRLLRIAATLALFCVPATGWDLVDSRLNQSTSSAINGQGSLAEIKTKPNMTLVILKSSILDASGADEPIIKEALAGEPRLAARHRFAYGLIARQLNQYIKKYRSLRPTDKISQSDFIVYFKLVEYRRLLNGVYPYGELYVIVPARETAGNARIIWRTRKIGFAEDAIKDMLRDLKQIRGER